MTLSPYLHTQMTIQENKTVRVHNECRAKVNAQHIIAPRINQSWTDITTHAYFDCGYI
jgi:hypothetical protein